MNDDTDRYLKTTKYLDYVGKLIPLTFRLSNYDFAPVVICELDAVTILHIIVSILCLRLILGLYAYSISTSGQSVLPLKEYGLKAQEKGQTY